MEDRNTQVAAPVSAEPRTILVVDDDADILEQVCSTMRGEGYAVVAAGGQEEAEEVMMQRRPDLAIVDLMMERMDSGFVLCHELKVLYPETPVIILTAVSAATGMDFSPRSTGQAWVQADTLMDKPVPPERLKREVRRLLQR